MRKKKISTEAFKLSLRLKLHFMSNQKTENLKINSWEVILSLLHLMQYQPSGQVQYVKGNNHQRDFIIAFNCNGWMDEQKRGRGRKRTWQEM